MNCPYDQICGGCLLRNLEQDDYKKTKESKCRQILQHIKSKNWKWEEPIFIGDGTRRRAALTFCKDKEKLLLGFNKKSSHEIVDITSCCLLTSYINQILPNLKSLLGELCNLEFTIKLGKKSLSQKLFSGDVLICQTDNGLDILLEYDAPINVNTRMIIADFCQKNEAIIRVSHRKNANDNPETLLQKATPYIKMGNYNVPIPAGTFLQASSKSEQILGQLVAKYLQNTKGNIADLFCGVGTFSYYIISNIKDIKIKALDLSDDLLKNFKIAVNANQISNIEIKKQNLFKYPLTAGEISSFEAIVFDPPRSGAKEQCYQIALADKKPKIIVAVSCNPLTFVNDANSLIDAGYDLKEVTMVDQFTYSNHSELVAVFILPD